MIERRESAGLLEVGSPHWVIARIEGFTQGTFNAVAEYLEVGRRFDLFLILASLLTVLLMGRFNGEIVSLVEGDRYLIGFFRIIRMFFWISCVASFMRLFVTHFDRRYQALLIISMMVSKWSVYFTDGIQANYWFEFIFYFVVIAYLYAMDLWSRRSAQAQPTFTVFTAGYLLVLFGWWSFGHWWGPGWAHFIRTKYNFSPERMFFPLLVFWWEGTNVIAPQKLFSVDRIFQILSPVTQVFPLPLKSRDYREATSRKLNRVRLQGLIDITVAILSVGLYYWLYHEVFLGSVNAGVSGLAFLWIGFVYYLILFLKSFWLFRMITAVGRTLGMDLKDGFNFALLAVDPADRWRRWSIYYNEWLRDNFFFPIMVKTNRIFLALFITFMVSFFLHSFGLFTFLGFRELDPMRELQFRSNFVYYLLQCFVVYFTSVTLSFWPQGHRRTGWFGVAATIFLMSVVHLLVWLAK